MADENKSNQVDQDHPDSGTPDAGKKDGAKQKSGAVDQDVQEEAAEERKEGGYQ
ncbi:hypothetical protein N825_09220 [Skermanella stibiiresistens SB22]|uniref:Uncharacterized protein n=1 Tax=Skermanella stibiiresistens SB22 TaxID=1385369 RepID=W9GV29_9PROT|nr:hypothetical protein [Skermanella stibiiresistens]EWY37750.1 hypothetical protein N825_09220 [Skermanella stibiiresistens SB22]